MKKYNVKLIRNSVIVGKCGVVIEDNIAWLENVLIFRKFRGLGYSKFLVKKAINLIKRTSVNTVKLHVKYDNHPAIKTYKKNGFKIVKKNYDNNELFGYTMQLNL
jgi:ribosomal protein S18 acetylase RimI-like enzyme